MGNTRHITENKALKKTHIVLFVCSLSLKLATTFAVVVFFWNAVPLISHLTALKGFGSWREKSGYRNGVSGGGNW